eukprot:gene8623-6055_t
MEVVERFLTHRRNGDGEAAYACLAPGAAMGCPWGGMHRGDRVHEVLQSESQFVKKGYLDEVPIKQLDEMTFQRTFQWDRGMTERGNYGVSWFRNLPVWREIYYVKDGQIRLVTADKLRVEKRSSLRSSRRGLLAVNVDQGIASSTTCCLTMMSSEAVAELGSSTILQACDSCNDIAYMSLELTLCPFSSRSLFSSYCFPNRIFTNYCITGHTGARVMSSSFAAAAKILFDSAQKVGAIGKVGKSRGHVRNVRFQRQAPKGSLDTVSSKVTKFLQDKKQSTVLQSDPSKVNLQFLFEQSKDKKKMEHGTFKSMSMQPLKAGDASDTKLTIPSFGVIPTSTKAGEGAAALDKKGPLPSAVAGRDGGPRGTTAMPEPIGAPLTTKPMSAEKVVAPPRPHPDLFHEAELITEDTPIFESSTKMSRTAEPSVLVAPTLPSAPAPRKEEAPRAAPSTSFSAFLAQSNLTAASEKPAGASEPLTVDSWEQQREKEIERLEAIRQEDEKRHAALVREEQHRTLGNEWVAKRSRMCPIRGTKYTESLNKVARSSSSAESLEVLESLIAAGLPEPILASAVAVIRFRLPTMEKVERTEAKNKLLHILESRQNLKNVLLKTKLSFASGQEFVELYHSISSAEQENLDYGLQKKAAIYLTLGGNWEEAMKIVSRERFSSRKQYELEMCVLRSAMRLEEIQKDGLRAAMRDLLQSRQHDGRDANLLMMSLEKGPQRRSLLQQAAASPEADEKVYASLIHTCRDVKDMTAVTLEMEKRGLNPRDLPVLRAILLKKLLMKDYAGFFEDIDDHRDTIGLRPFHFSAMVRCVGMETPPNVVSMVVERVKDSPPESSLWAIKKLLSKLFDRGMWNEIVSLWEHCSATMPMEKLLPNGVAFYNDALTRVGRAPLSSLTTADIGYTRTVKEEPHATHSTSMEDVLDIASSTELMLSLARERNWVKALQVVRQLPALTDENAPSLTLLFNCALSAAVEEYDAVQEVLQLMGSKGIPANCTTTNTVLSSFSKLSKLDEALTFFREATAKDANTYMIVLSLLANRNMHDELLSVFEEAKKGSTKLPSSLFAVVLGATVNHSWEASFHIFQDLIKMHGRNPNEALKAQVLRCLEKNGRSAEITKINKLLEGKRKKK